MNPPPPPPSSQMRASSGSARPQRTTNPDKQISQIEKSVTHLLVATKQLLETLTQWSRGQAQEEEVSDVYVRLGYEFNLACRAFNSIGVETSDLGPVPDLLRHILEDTLSQPASPQALDNYLPRIRDIIINLLHGLKRKQSKLRGRGGREAAVPSRSATTPIRQGSIASSSSNEAILTNVLDEAAGTSNRENKSSDDSSYAPANASAGGGTLTRGSINRQSLRKEPEPSVKEMSPAPKFDASIPNIPVVSPQTGQRPTTNEVAFPYPPPPPPKQQDALTALQRGGELERRASRRFSAYQISKHLGASPNGIPVMPPAQNSPVPNRGREVRESLSAVRSRQSVRARSGGRGMGASPSRVGAAKAPERISEEGSDSLLELTTKNIPPIKPPTEPSQDDSPTVKTPEEYHKPMTAGSSSGDAPIVGATINGPMSPYPDGVPPLPSPSEASRLEPPPIPPEHQEPLKVDTQSSESTEQKRETTVTPVQLQIMDLGSSPPQGKELTLFLQYKSKIKKFVLPEGYSELTMARLQLGFIEKFAWNTLNDGVELPEIYIQDPVSGVRHELEDMSDVKDRSVLVLNYEVLDEVKKHIDDGMGGLQKTLEGVRALLDGQGSMMQRFSDRQLEASKEMARMSAVPSHRPSQTPSFATGATSISTASGVSTQEVQNLRRDIAVLRQTYATMSSDFFGAITDIRSKADRVKVAASVASTPSYQGDAGREHINQGKRTLSHDSEALVNRVDDLSDLVEELRKDVVTRGVRPLPRQLEDISKEISKTSKELVKVKEFVKREKPVWTKIWEQELQLVMNEREDLTQQDDLIADLDGDLEDINGVFKLVEEATKQQNLQANTGTGLRSTSRNLAFETDVDPHEAKTGMLDEVRALQPNHESRLEAIERAEKARQKELENRKGGVFQREVEKFVEEGKLRKTGGADEVERMRKIKDERARKENWERQEARKVELEKKRAEEAAAATKAPSSGGEGQENDASDEVEKSQSPEPAFEDAEEKKEATEEIPPTEAADEKADDAVADGPPQLPEVKLDHDDQEQATNRKSTASPSSSNRSWWQPAIFD